MKYVMLMRHGEHEAVESSLSPKRWLTKKGEEETRAVAERLRFVLRQLDGDDKISIGVIWRAHTDEVLATSKLVIEVLGDLIQSMPEDVKDAKDVKVNVNVEDVKDLEPATFKPYKNMETHVHLADKLRYTLTALMDSKATEPTTTKPNAILVIGHQPLLGWIAYELLGEAVPIARSELLCFALDDVGWLKRLYKYLRWVLSIGLLKRSYGHLCWVLSPSSEAAMEEIKGKIRSKMEIAKLLSVFITTALGFLLGSLIDQQKMDYLSENQWAFYVSAGLFFTAASLYLATMYAYDRLLMPTRFWGEKPLSEKPEKRPKELQRNNLFICIICFMLTLWQR
jgi:phosphohistidine phosphatase SixA